MNLAPGERHKLQNIHVPYVHPGPKKPKDWAPLIEINTAELLYAYHHGFMVEDARTGEVFCCRIVLAGCAYDARGVPKALRAAQTPADVGACWICHI